MYHSLTALALLFVFTQPLSAQSAPGWKLKAGDSFYVQEVTDSQQRLAVLGQTKTQKAKQTIVYKIDVQSVNAENGEIALTIKLDGLASEGQTAGGAIFFRRMEGSGFNLVLSKDFQVTKFEGYTAFVTRVAGGNEKQALLFQSILGEETFRATLTNIFTLFPGKPLQDDQSWESKSTLPLGPFGMLETTRKITLGEVAEKDGNQLANLSITGSARYKQPEKQYKSLPFSVKEGDLKTDGAKGDAIFNLTTGRLQSLNVAIDLKGTLEVKIGTQTEELKLTRKREVIITVSEKKPVLE